MLLTFPFIYFRMCDGAGPAAVVSSDVNRVDGGGSGKNSLVEGGDMVACFLFS
jgi:hypothetical protein